MEAFLQSLGVDRYERQARLKPALLVLLPLLAMAAIWLPKVWSILGGIAALVAGCGLMFLLAKLARYRGRAVERAMIDNNGGRHTTIFLRHRDAAISRATKARIHMLLSQNGTVMPTEAEEKASPSAADEQYRGAVDWLLEATRDETRHALVKDELVDYGFRRNLLGLKPIGVVVTAVCLGVDLWLAWVNLYLDDIRFWTAIVLGTGLLGSLLVWVTWVRLPFVDDASQSYALRLLAQCHKMATRASPS
jgi:hypothetical protein